jgi:D-alanyl-D-alanine carboxypeptidase
MRLILTRALRQASPVKTRRTEPVLIAEPRPARRPSAAAAALIVRPWAARAPDHSTAGDFEVQVGAYNSTVEAERALLLARGRVGGLLDTYPARTIPIEKDNRQLYRARFSGFNADLAASACLELRRQRIDCFVSRAE